MLVLYQEFVNEGGEEFISLLLASFFLFPSFLPLFSCFLPLFPSSLSLSSIIIIFLNFISKSVKHLLARPLATFHRGGRWNVGTVI